MQQGEYLVWLIGAGALLLLLSFLGKRAEWLLNLALRSIFGTILICFLNYGIGILGYPVSVGINALTVLTVGILGLPGVLALYGLVLYQLF